MNSGLICVTKHLLLSKAARELGQEELTCAAASSGGMTVGRKGMNSSFSTEQIRAQAPSK